jgi:molybdopterin synthase sulfur carrier subunit
MNVTVFYFARLREAVGHGRDQFVLPADVMTVAQLRAWLAARGAPWAGAFSEVKRIRAAVDQTMAGDDARLHDGAEVAFFPPVTGG